MFAVAPARRGFVWRELGLVLLPDTQVFRKRPPRADKRLGRALASFADLRSRRLHRPRGPRRRQAARLRDEGGRGRHARLPLPRVPRRGPALRPARAARQGLEATSAPTRGAPTLSKLGGKAWQNLKARARESVQRARGRADRALRAAPAGCRARPTTSTNEWLERLETEFPYRETEDQARAIEAVKEDLEAPRPMDRLVCGDVGFGKTEVAVRAAFAVAVNGKQTLVLCPTTILAEQHWNTFRDALPRLPGPRRDGLALPQARRDEADPEGLRGGEGRGPRRHAPRPLAAT